MSDAKAAIASRHQQLLEARYDLDNRSTDMVLMTGGKQVQVGVRAKLAERLTWDKLSDFSPQQIREQDLFPIGYLPLPVHYDPKAKARA